MSSRTTVYVIATLLFVGTAGSAHAQNCPGASPTDTAPDSTAIQACLDNGTQVYLVPGNPGYIINDKIRFRSDDTLLTSVGGKARLKAASGLVGPLLEVQGANNYVISEIIFDGDRQNRTQTSLCFGTSFSGQYGSNAFVSGSGWAVHHIETINAMCGSGLEVAGDNFQIYSVNAIDNGGEAPSGPWADGITLNRCDSGYVHDNYFKDNTDVDLIVGRGTNCRVMWNSIEHVSRFGFAGINSGARNDTQAGSEVKYNQIDSGYNLLSFGIIIGFHPWDSSGSTYNVGEVWWNEVTGAVVNLAVDGIEAGSVQENTAIGAQGDRGYGCNIAANYTIGDFGSTALQSGWNAVRVYHAGTCFTP